MALTGAEQDVYGSAASPIGPLNETGICRVYPDLFNMGAGDDLTLRIYRKNDGTNLRLASSNNYVNA